MKARQANRGRPLLLGALIGLLGPSVQASTGTDAPHPPASAPDGQGEAPIATAQDSQAPSQAASGTDAAPQATDETGVETATDPGQRNGREIFDQFIAGLAQPECEIDTSKGRWKHQFRHAPDQLAQHGGELLPLFGYVVDELDAAGLPSEYALIPFVESGYKPGARSSAGPAGMWQFIGTTARNHGITMQAGYDGRLSPVESTRAAVRYLKILHTMFGRDWRLAVMAYNAGEYRVLQSMRRAGMNAGNARPAELPGLSGVTYAYVEKLHAIACLLKQSKDDPRWLASLDRPVPRLAAHDLGNLSLDAWARDRGHDPALLRRLNPALANSAIRNPGKALRVLAPSHADASHAQVLADAGGENGTGATPATGAPASQAARALLEVRVPRTHTVRRGESAWTIARRYGLSANQLLARNKLDARALLHPGMVLDVGTGE